MVGVWMFPKKRKVSTFVETFFSPHHQELKQLTAKKTASRFSDAIPGDNRTNLFLVAQ
jgi:hypothetical protein